MALAAVLMLFGFFLSTALVQEGVRERELPERRDELTRLVRQRQDTIRRTAADVAELSAGLAEVRDRAGRESRELHGVLGELERLGAAAGDRALGGPGIVVELTDSGRLPATRQELTDLRIQDADLQQVVNALWQAGAEAIALNGHRVVATTAIREAGSRVLVNYEAVASPYRVSAIGDPATLRTRLDASEVARRFEVWTQAYGLGFRVVAATRVTVPSLGSLPDFLNAAPVEASA